MHKAQSSRRARIHVRYREYAQAGSDIITLNTFDLNTTDILRVKANIREEIQKYNSLFIGSLPVGSLGPAEMVLSLNKSVEEFDKLEKFYENIVHCFCSSGVNNFIIETATDSLNVKAALCAVSTIRRSYASYPINVIVSCSPDRNG